jgi:hypothetical protein
MLKLRKKNVRESLASLEEKVYRRSLELEQKLLESQWSWLDNLVDVRAAYIDEQTGEPWGVLGRNNGSSLAGLPQENSEPWLTPEEHKFIRWRSRALSRNPYAQGFLTNMRSYVVGTGHIYNVQIKSGYNEKLCKPYKLKLQNFIDVLLKKNKWKRRQREIIWRLHRDGEVFIRIFPQDDGYALFRFVEPWQVETPPEWLTDASASYGIKTDPEDVETVEMYFISGEEVDAHEVQHRKANVDCTVKRGLSSLYCVATNLNRGSQLLQNMSTLLQTRAAIAMIRKHKKTSGAVRSFASNAINNPIQYTNPITKENIRGKPLRPGSVIDTTDQTDYEFPSLNSNVSDGTNVLQAELRAIASSKAMAEYMVGSDASNSNYSNTMVAESPAVKFFEGEQDEMVEQDLELIWAAVDYAIDAGILPADCKTCCEIDVGTPKLVQRDPVAQAQADSIYIDKRVKSPQTCRSELSLDSAQEDKNWREFDDTHLEGGTLPMDPQSPDYNGGGSRLPAAEDVVAAQHPEAALLNMAGGISGYLEIMQSLQAGVIHREQAINAVMTFFKLSRTAAEAMVGSA